MPDNVTVTFPQAITKDIVEGQIKAAVIAALAKDPEALVAAVVKAAMTEKRDHYNAKPIWDEMINSTIREAAMVAFKEWLDENAQIVKTRVRAELNAKKTEFVKRIVDGMVEAAQTGFHFSVSIKDR